MTPSTLSFSASTTIDSIQHMETIGFISWDQVTQKET